MINNKLLKIIPGLLVTFVVVVLLVRYEANMPPFNRKLSREVLSRYFPEVDIKATYFINMDRSVERRESFIERFHKSNGPLPLIRSAGVLIEDKSIAKPGDYGCSLAHVNVLKKISEEENQGWYLVCEDDGYGNFGGIRLNREVRAIVGLGEKKFINLSRQIYNGKLLIDGHSLSKVHGRATAYLVDSGFAGELSKMVYENGKKIPVDLVFDRMLREPSFLKKNCNGLGAFVGLIDPPSGEIKSDRENLN